MSKYFSKWQHFPRRDSKKLCFAVPHRAGSRIAIGVRIAGSLEGIKKTIGDFETSGFYCRYKIEWNRLRRNRVPLSLYLVPPPYAGTEDTCP